MKRQKQTYLGYLFLFLWLLTGFAGEVQAQRALKHRTGQLTADSIRIQHVTDSLALLDTLSLQRQQQIDALEAPVDTAALASQSDSIQKAAQKKLKKNGFPIPTNRYGWHWLFPERDRSTTVSIGNFPSYTEVLSDVHMH